jgi:hypothetical protein
MGLALIISIITLWIFRGFRPARVDKWFRRLQLLSAAAYSLGMAPTTRRRRWASSPACW